MMALADPPAPSLLHRARCAFNDLGNAERLAMLAEGRLLWVVDKKTWVGFDGNRWSLEIGEKMAGELTHAVEQGIAAEAKAVRIASPDQLLEVFGYPVDSTAYAEWLAAHKAKTGQSERANAMLKQARWLPNMNVMNLDAFDVDPLALNCRNGVVRFVETDGQWEVDFRQGHGPEDRMLQLAEVNFDRAALCPHWRERMALIHPDADMAATVQKAYGCSITGLTDAQAFFVHLGKGNDGKSMTNKIIETVLGRYAIRCSPKTFLESPTQAGSAHQSDLVRLNGDYRFIVADEPKKKSKWDSERIKQLTGSAITARGAYAHFEVQFIPRGKLHVECNIMPGASTDDFGAMRRQHIFPYERQFGVTAGMKDEDGAIVEARLRGELSGVLNWLIEGALAWLPQRKFARTQAMKIADANYWKGASPMADWFMDWCDTSDPQSRTESTAVFNHFCDWYKKEGLEEDAMPNKTKFGTWLSREKLINNVKGDFGRKVRKGLRLRTDAEVQEREREEGQLSGGLIDAPNDDYDDGVEW
jgi:putative DNA primase/helicase